ncbi:hypothetical protein MYP14_03335 [Rhodococcus pyridinivorans]|uniref:LGFP repeat-containing protein n=1 Tax=Rhodococcus pyridinivorans TaxID=103816 RepID=UPI001FFE5DE5|nr:hypothetical protein [Rhodococcus pyridinivorans]UPK64434.1 hypothetical protein MYP14_03335 [Rhodococcus pyridinivorans]
MRLRFIGKRLRFEAAMAPPLTLYHSKDIRCQMDLHTQRGSFMSRHRWLGRCVVAGTAVVMIAAGESAALAQPTTTSPAAPTTTTLSTAPDLAPTDRPVETSADPCLAPTTTPSSTATATTPPSVPCATTPPAPEPVPTISATAAAPQPAQAPAVPTEVSTQTPESGPTEVPPISKVPYASGPTENPNATIVPGQMRSDRQEIPEPFTKADADLAETLEAQAQASRSAFAPMACQYFWPSPHIVCGAILDKYLSLGAENSFLKHPINVELSNPDGIGSRQEFLVGPIYAHPTAGAHPVVNSFMTKWGSFGWEASFLGYPTTDEIVNSDGIGRRQHFQNADIYWHPVASPGANVIGGAIRDKWALTGGEGPGGLLGYPITDEIWVGASSEGRMNRFERGVLYWHPNHGAWPVTSPVLDEWSTAGYEQSVYGYPVSDASPNDIGGTFQAFEHRDIETPRSPVRSAYSCIDVALSTAQDSGLTSGFQFGCTPFGVTVTGAGGQNVFVVPDSEEFNQAPSIPRLNNSTIECDTMEPTNISAPSLNGPRVSKHVDLCIGAASSSGQVEWSKEFAFQVANILDNRTNQRVETRVTTLGFPSRTFALTYRVRQDISRAGDRTVTEKTLVNSGTDTNPAYSTYNTPLSEGKYFVEVINLGLEIPSLGYDQTFGGLRFAIGRYTCSEYSGSGPGDLCQWTNPIDDHT